MPLFRVTIPNEVRSADKSKHLRLAALVSPVSEARPGAPGMISPRASVILLATLIVLAGCKPVRPQLQPPRSPRLRLTRKPAPLLLSFPPPNPAGGAWQPASPSDGMLRGKWWEIYQDPQLNQLEERIAANNQTLRSAVETYLAARDQVASARSAFFPTLSAGPSVSHEKLSGNRPLANATSNPTTTTLCWPARQAGSPTSGAASAATSKPPAPTPRPAPPTWPTSTSASMPSWRRTTSSSAASTPRAACSNPPSPTTNTSWT